MPWTRRYAEQTLTSIAQISRGLVILQTDSSVLVQAPKPIQFSTSGIWSLENHLRDAKSTYLLGSYRILGDAPAVAEAIGQLEYGQDQLALCSSSFLHTRL